MKKVDKKGIDPEGKNLGIKKTAIIFQVYQWIGKNTDIMHTC